MLAVQERLAVDVADAQALRAKAARGDKAALADAARQFEAMLVAQMLKSMRQARFNDEDDPMTGGDAMKLYQDLLDQQWATHLSKGKGLGFADMMVKALERQAGADAGQPNQNGGRAAGIDDKPATPPPATVDSAPSTGKLAPPAAANPEWKSEFISRMRPHAEAAATATGIPAEFILAHAALESGWGRHEIRDAGGRASHNLFGIKAGRNWDGAVAETLTTEYRDGLPVKLSQRFRAYADYSSAFADYANLLKTRYGASLAAGADASAFARGLAAGGYASDPAYAGKLQSVIARVAMVGN